MSLKNGHDAPNVTSLDEARRRTAEKAKRERRASGGRSGDGQTRSVRDWIVGGAMILMAAGAIAALVMSMGTVSVGGAR